LVLSDVEYNYLTVNAAAISTWLCTRATNPPSNCWAL